MTLTETIAAVHAAGRSISSNGTTLAIGPGKPLPQAVLEALRAHKPELLELLRQAKAAPAINDTPEGMPFVRAALQAFSGARVKWLSEADYNAIGFRSESSLPPEENPLDSASTTPTAASMGGVE